MFSDSPTVPTDQSLVACAVYDQQGCYIGMVVKAYRDVDDQLSLILQGSKSQHQIDKLRVAGESIQHIDVRRKKIYVDLDAYPIGQVEVESLPLWQEQVVVNRTRRKVGEVSIRKVTDTYMVQVPIRSEKLVVEDVETGAVLTHVDLTNTHISQEDLLDGSSNITYTNDQLVKGYLEQLKDAVSFFKAVSQYPNNSFVKGKTILSLLQPQQSQHDRLETVCQTFESASTGLQMLSGLPSAVVDRCQGVSLEVLISDRDQASTYRNWLSRYRQPKQISHGSRQRSPARLPSLPS